jgi:hypothetical protein
LINSSCPSGRPSWSHGYPPMLYPTHCTGLIIPVINERLVEVSAYGSAEDFFALTRNTAFRHRHVDQPRDLR